ncbi:Major facilitator superfamily domain general substrate transporter [Penicillium freii]|nr:Major facilitator superfamily domain general substrate transporter [Penicillium freii]
MFMILPFLLMGGMISSIGYGLMSTLDTTTPVAKWIGYQVLYGVGSGSIQGLVAPEQIPLAMAIIIFAQNMGAATSLIVANAIFSNSLRSEL